MEWGKYTVLHQMQREGAAPSRLYPTEGMGQSALPKISENLNQEAPESYSY